MSTESNGGAEREVVGTPKSPPPQRGSAPEREEALRLAREITATQYDPRVRFTDERKLSEALLALAADLEAAEQRFVAQERRYRATVEWGDKALMDACERERTRADDAERNLATAQARIEELEGILRERDR